jgi:galactokinase
MPSRTWRAPGRVNIIGEHIDYLGGTVLPFACDLELRVAVEDADEIELHSSGGDLDAHVRGVIEAVRTVGLDVHGCRGTVTSDIPVGAGLSSSAALAAGIVLALTRGARVTPEVLRRVEQIATGVYGGLMDQTTVLEGRAEHAILLDCATGTLDHVPIPGDIGFVVIDTGTRRQLADGRYAQRRTEVESGAAKRVRHATSEQRRVYEAVDALRAGDVATLGGLVSDSHASLRDDFEVSSPELDAAVEKAMSHPGCYGARLVGAGFAGCVLAVVEAAQDRAVAGMFERAYVVSAVDGASEVLRPA